MGPGVVGFAPLLEVGLLERIGLAGAIRGVLELAPGVIHLSQAELKRPASSSGQAGFGQPSLDRRPVGVRKFVPEAGCQPGQRTGVPGIMPQSLTEFSLGSVKVAELLEQAPQRGVGASQVGLLLMAWRKHARASSSRPSSWRALPRMVSASGKSGRSLTASRQCVKACAGWPNSSSISPRLLWASAETGSSCTALRKCSIAETLSPRSRSALARLLWAAKPGRSRIASRKWVTASSTARKPISVAPRLQ